MTARSAIQKQVRKCLSPPVRFIQFVTSAVQPHDGFMVTGSDMMFESGYQDAIALLWLNLARSFQVHGFVKVVPVANAELVRLQQEEGYACMR